MYPTPTHYYLLMSVLTVVDVHEVERANFVQ